MNKDLSPAALNIIKKMQQNELTESVIYEEIAKFAKGDTNKATLRRLSQEEKAHYETGALYLLNADKTTIDKMEYKANKKVYNELIPFSKLKEMCEKHLSVAELSDYFGIPIQDVLVAEFLYNNIENYKEG